MSRYAQKRVESDVKTGPPGCSAAELGALVGVSSRRVRELCDEGHMLRAGPRGRFLRDESILKYCEHLRKMAARHGEGDAGASLTAERTRLAKAQANAAELKEQALRGELVSASDVTAKWKALLAALRSRFLGIPSRISSQLPHLTRPEIDLIDDEIRDALDDLSNG